MSNQLGLLQTRGFELRLQSLMLHDASRMLSQWRCEMTYGAAAAGLDSLLRRLELGLHGLPLFACRLQPTWAWHSTGRSTASTMLAYDRMIQNARV